MTNRVLVLGGGGFLGSHLIRWLLEQGFRVRSFDQRLPEMAHRDSNPNLSFVEGNLLNDADLDRALSGVDMVMHFISMTVPSRSIDAMHVEFDTNVKGTAALLERMSANGVHRICFPSSGGTVYGSSARPHREDEPLAPTCPHGFGKLVVEEMLRFYAREKGLDYQIWRIANPYGDVARKHLAQGVVDSFLQRLRDGQALQIWGDGTAVRDYIYIDDAIEAIGALIRAEPWGETVNIGTGVGTSIRQILELVVALDPEQAQVQQIAGYTGPDVSRLAPDKLCSLTGWRPRVSLEEGIRQTWAELGWDDRKG